MLTKLLKYDLKWILKVTTLYYLLALFFASLGRLFGLSDALFFTVISNICNGITIALMISGLITGVLRSGARFSRNFYKDESYLTHTLPVKKETLLLSKFMAGIITIFLSIISIIICLFIMYYSPNLMDSIKMYINLITQTINISVWGVLANTFLSVFLELVLFLILIYLGFVIGNRNNGNKNLVSIILVFAFYMITQVVMLIFMLIYGLIDSSVLDMFISNNVNMTFINPLLIYCNVVYLGEIIVCYLICNKSFKKGVNVD